MELRRDDPGDILAVPVAGHGWAYAGDLSKLYRAWNADRCHVGAVAVPVTSA